MGTLADDHDALLGRTIAGKFLIESFLGRGAMGAVYRARQIALDKLVAIKVLHSSLVTDPAFTARFQREAKAASRLDHPNSVRVLDYGEDDGLCYIAMELLDGRTLFKVIQAEGLLATPRIVDLLRQILAALAMAHDMGVVHRDLKPENIVILESRDDEGGMKEVVKVCDFGIAKLVSSRAEASTANSEKLTGDGSVLGTPEYMSPEQARGEALDTRSDLYSVGVILYELLAGKVPFDAETALGILLKHIVEEPRPPSERQPGVDRGLEAVCLKAMQKSPDKRYSTARDMRHALMAALEEYQPMLSTSPMPLTRPVTGSHAFPVIAPSTAIATTVDIAARAPSGVIITERESAVMSRPNAGRELQSSLPPPTSLRLRKLVLGSLAVGAIVAVGAMALRSHPQQAVVSVEPSPAVATVSPVSTGKAAQSVAPLVPAAHDVLREPLVASPPSAQASAAPLVSAKPSAHPPVGSPSTTAPSASATPSASAPSLPPAPPGPFDAARVQIGLIKVEHANSADVMNALPMLRFTQCYREGLRTRGTATGGPGVLHLVFDRDGMVTEASFAGSEALAPIGQCVVNSSTGRRVKMTEPGSSSAEIDLSFKPE